MTSRHDISDWIDEGKAHGATHMLVVCDTFEYDDYPVYITPGADCNAIIRHYGLNMQRVMEVYDLSMEIGAQLAERRAWHPPIEETR